jgi:hypothetical protein
VTSMVSCLNMYHANAIFSESYAEIPGDQELFMAEKSFLNLTCLIHSVETPQGVFWRHKEKVNYLEKMNFMIYMKRKKILNINQSNLLTKMLWHFSLSDLTLCLVQKNNNNIHRIQFDNAHSIFFIY